MRVAYSKKFVRSFKKLPPEIKARARAVDEIFRKDPTDRRLRLHKLHGDLEDFHSFSVDFSYRIIVEFKKSNIALFLDIGTHDLYE